MTVDPCSKVVSPSGDVLSLDHFTVSSPLGIWQNPLSVDLCGIKPVTLERNNSYWEVKFMELVALIGIWGSGGIREGGILTNKVRIDSFGVSFRVVDSIVDTKRFLSI